MHLGVSVANYIGCIEFEGASIYGVVDAQAINVLQMVKVIAQVLVMLMLVVLQMVKVQSGIGSSVADVSYFEDDKGMVQMVKLHPSLGGANVSGCIDCKGTPWC